MQTRLIKLLLNFFEFLNSSKFDIKFQQDEISFKKSLVEELNGIKKFFKEQEGKSHELFNRHLVYYDWCLQYIIYLHVRLFLMLSEKFLSSKKSFKHIEYGTYSYQAFVLLTPTLTNLTNSLLSVRLVLKNGFNNQANQLIRSYIEYADIGIAIMSNEEFFKNYRDMLDNPEKENDVWWNYLRQTSITKILKKSLITMYKDEEHWDTIFKVRNDIYKVSSDYIHGNLGANLFGAYSTPYEDENGFSLGGNPSKEMEESFLNIIIYSIHFLQNIMSCFVYYHKLPFKNFEDDGEFFVRSFKYAESFQKIIIQMYTSDKEE